MDKHIAYFTSLIGSENLISDDQKIPWGTDYTKAYTPNPEYILFPQTTAQVSEILKYCYKNKISVVPSGGRTGLSGGAVASKGEIVLSTKRMTKVFNVNSIEKTMHVQSGVVTKHLQNVALENGLYFPVDFASSGSSHIGGNIATNAGGIKVIRYGVMRAWVLGLQVVLADGTILDMNNACIKNNTGYDLKELFIGSEGTLGIITEALIKLTSPPNDLVVSLFAVPSLEKVLELFSLSQKMRLPLTAYEFFTQFGLLRVQQHTALRAPFEKLHPFYALVETEKVSGEHDQLLESFIEKAMEAGLIVDGVQAQNSQQVKDFWGLRENISESISAIEVAHKNDISLPLSNLTVFCAELEKLIKTEYPGFEVVLFGHIGDGNLHVNYIKPKAMDKTEFFKFAHHADEAMFGLVKKYGGSVSAEHGIGLVKKDFLHYTRSPEEIATMKLIKKALDPHSIMNPGKIF
jgi:glycolate oxidase subunit GlcD